MIRDYSEEDRFYVLYRGFDGWVYRSKPLSKRIAEMTRTAKEQELGPDRAWIEAIPDPFFKNQSGVLTELYL